MPDVTVVIPTIPPRACGSAPPGGSLLERAIRSVGAQTVPAVVQVELDLLGEGPAVMRDRALQRREGEDGWIRTPWVTFLDDDDEMLPVHVERMLGCARATGAQMVYPWPVTVGGTNPHEHLFGKPFDLECPVQTTIVTLVRTEVAREVGFRTIGDLNAPGRLYGAEDWDFTQRVAAWCLEHGQSPGVVHLPERTWLWHHHGGNTSGLPNRWFTDRR